MSRKDSGGQMSREKKTTGVSLSSESKYPNPVINLMAKHPKSNIQLVTKVHYGIIESRLTKTKEQAEARLSRLESRHGSSKEQCGTK